jgi:hypothetical protein
MGDKGTMVRRIGVHKSSGTGYTSTLTHEPQASFDYTWRRGGVVEIVAKVLDIVNIVK